MEYQIVSGKGIKQIEERVTYAIEMGWEPLGGVGVDGDFWFYQAMIRKEVG